MDETMDLARIADDIAARAREVIAERGLADLISVTEHGHRQAYTRAMREQEQAMLSELYRALRPIAEEFNFCDIHIWTDGRMPVCLLREKLLSTVA